MKKEDGHDPAPESGIPATKRANRVGLKQMQRNTVSCHAVSWRFHPCFDYPFRLNFAFFATNIFDAGSLFASTIPGTKASFARNLFRPARISHQHIQLPNGTMESLPHLIHVNQIKTLAGCRPYLPFLQSYFLSWTHSAHNLQDHGAACRRQSCQSVRPAVNLVPRKEAAPVVLWGACT